MENLSNIKAIEVPKDLRSAVRYKNNKIYVLKTYRVNPLFLTFESNVRSINKNVLTEIVSAEALMDIENENATGNLNDEKIVKIYKKLFEAAAEVNVSDIHLIKFNELYTDIYMRRNGKVVKFMQLTHIEGSQVVRSIYQNIKMADVSYLEGLYQSGQIHAFDLKEFLPKNVSSIRIQRGPMMNGEFMVLRLLYKHNFSNTQRTVQIGQILLQKNIITEEVLNNALSIQEEWVSKGKQIRLGDILIANNFITESQLEEVLFEQKGSLSLGIDMFIRYGYTNEQAKVLAKAARQPQGMVIFSGPTGSGKSTALKVALEFQALLYPDKVIYTIEDPPEYNIYGARQLPVLNATSEEQRGSKFAEGLRVAMRSDPDILMVGEIRDEATAQVAIDAVITGHQMWTTVHAIDVFAILQRLLRFGINEKDLLDEKLLNVLVGQRLLPRLCDRCKIDYNSVLVDDDLRDIFEDVGSIIKLRNPTGCEECNNTGISGRVVVAEVLDVTEKLINDIKEKGIQESRREFETSGFTMIKHGIMRLLKGEVDPRDLISVVGNVTKEDILGEYRENII